MDTTPEGDLAERPPPETHPEIGFVHPALLLLAEPGSPWVLVEEPG